MREDVAAEARNTPLRHPRNNAPTEFVLPYLAEPCDRTRNSCALSRCVALCPALQPRTLSTNTARMRGAFWLVQGALVRAMTSSAPQFDAGTYRGGLRVSPAFQRNKQPILEVPPRTPLAAAACIVRRCTDAAEACLSLPISCVAYSLPPRRAHTAQALQRHLPKPPPGATSPLLVLEAASGPGEQPCRRDAQCGRPGRCGRPKRLGVGRGWPRRPAA